MLRGLGMLFIIWNVPYAVALWHPVRNHISLSEAQTIGLVGESIIFLLLPVTYKAPRGVLSKQSHRYLSLLTAWVYTHHSAHSPETISG